MSTKGSTIIAGRHIYRNDHGQTILYDKHSGCGYIINKQSEGKFTVYYHRLLITLLVLIFGINMGVTWKIMVPVSLLLLLILQVMYRVKFLPSLTCIKKYVPAEKRSLSDSIAETQTRSGCITYGLALLVFGVMIVINGYVSHLSAVMLTADWAILAGCAVLAYFFLTAAGKTVK